MGYQLFLLPCKCCDNSKDNTFKDNLQKNAKLALFKMGNFS